MSAPATAALAERCDRVLAAMDAVLRHESLQAEVLQLTKDVVGLRDALIESLRAGGAGTKRALDHANALLSLVVSIQYPVRGTQWEKLTQARAGLAQLQAQIGESASGTARAASDRASAGNA